MKISRSARLAPADCRVPRSTSGQRPGLDTDPVTSLYLQQAMEDPRLRDVVARADLPPAFRACWGDQLLARPLFLPASELDAAVTDMLAVFDILSALPRSLFGGDAKRYLASLGFDGQHAATLLRFMRAAPTRYGRVDLYHDGEGFRLLEFNVASDVGGTQIGQLMRGLLAAPSFAEFAARHQLDFVDTGERIAQTFKAAAATVTDESMPTVAILEAPGGIAEDRLILAGLVETLASHGLDVLVAEPAAIRYERDQIMIHARPVHVVLRYFNIDDVATDPPRDWAQPLFRAHEEGRVVLWTGMDSAAYSNKMTLALLSDPRWSSVLSASERHLIDRILPWTRLLTRSDTTVDGEIVDLIEYCRAYRDNLLLKPLRGWGGHGLVMGWEHNDRQWHRALEECQGAGYLVQRRVRPRHEPVVNPVNGQVEPWIVNWGLFVTPDGYAGAQNRAIPADGGSIVNFTTNPRTRATGLFSYPDCADTATGQRQPGEYDDR